MNILVEGIDCSGKSTLVKEIKNRLGVDSLALGHKDGNQFERFLKAYANADGVVIERGHASEVIYSRLYGRSRPLTTAELEVLDNILALKFVVVHALPDPEVAAARYQARNNVYQPTALEQLVAGRELFKEFYSIRTIDYIYKSRDYDELEELITALKARTE